MVYLKVRNVTRKAELGQKVRQAKSLKERAIGLLGTPTLPPGEGLWISPCKSIHTFFMRYAIDALFLDDGGQVIGKATISPWRMSSWYAKSRGVLELPSGTLTKTGTQVGDRISFEGLN